MKQVITLIGQQAGQAIYMRSHEADAAVATGVAAWPDDPMVAHFRKRLGLDDPLPAVERRELAIRRVDGGNELTGPWPKHIVLQPRMLASNMVKMNPSGIIHINIGDRTATYRAVQDPRDGRILADLVEIVDSIAEPEPLPPVQREPEPAEVTIINRTDEELTVETKEADGRTETTVTIGVSHEIPDNWRGMHWKHRLQLAEKISGEKVTDVAVANGIIEKAKGDVSR